MKTVSPLQGFEILTSKTFLSLGPCCRYRHWIQIISIRMSIIIDGLICMDIWVMIGDDSNHFIIKEYKCLVGYLQSNNNWYIILALNIIIITITTPMIASITMYWITRPTTTQPAPHKLSTVLNKTGLHINHDLVHFIQMIFASYHHSLKWNQWCIYSSSNPTPTPQT